MSAQGKNIPSLLIVDDEEVVLSSLRGVFSLETDYRVIEASEPRRALQEVERTPLDVVISDFLMPQMNGIDFLKEVRRLQPEAARILLTGYADKENAIRAINEVSLYQYIEKPWDNQALLMVVRNALAERSLRRQLGERISDLDRLRIEHTELADRQRSLDRELEMAARVQRSLLPRNLPQPDGFRLASFYRPSQALGGDYYDFAARGDEAVVLVSDVIGHGLQAALTTMLLKGIFQEAGLRASGPVELLTEMNGKLKRLLPEGMYAAAAVAWIEPAGARVHFANAGLPYPFVLRASERRVDQVTLGGPPLGLFEEAALARFETREVKLRSGDVLLLATDGLGSIPGQGEELFEDHHLPQTLAELNGRDGGDVIASLVGRALRFSGDQPLLDDVNLVAITKV